MNWSTYGKKSVKNRKVGRLGFKSGDKVESGWDQDTVHGVHHSSTANELPLTKNSTTDRRRHVQAQWKLCMYKAKHNGLSVMITLWLTEE